jgi:opacity protein-like surface antigen
MKSFLMLAAAFVLSASAAHAQTVVSGSTVPGPVPSPENTAPVSTSNGGSPRARGHVADAPNMTREDKKMMRKMGKVKYKPEATKASKAE